MRRKRIMVIGPSKCGKTSLVNAINDYDGPLRKTQDMIYGRRTIDVPGSYLENPWMYKHLIAAAQDASQILILVDQSSIAEAYAPGFAKVFRCPVTGVITKGDLNPENEENCRSQLKSIGVDEPYFRVSIPTGEGVDALKEHIFNIS